MKISVQCDRQETDRKGERGAALLTTLLISILLLSAGMALVTSTSLSTTTSIDSTAEMQAYSAAEAGLEATLNVLRGNVAPDASLAGTMMNFRTAAHPALSNKTTDALATGTSAVARLSGWLNYSYQNPSAINDWRVPLTATYAPLTGIAYRIEISDPDDQGPIITRRITTDVSYVPKRVLVRSEGFGPKGAIKRLEMIVALAGEDIKTPAAIALAGGSPINLDFGSSTSIDYSGDDMAIPPDVTLAGIAVSAGNEGQAQAAIDALHSGSQILPNTPGTISGDNSANFLRDADAARAFLIEKRAIASENGRLFSSKAEAIAAGGLGTTDEPKLTFIDNYSTGVKVDLGANHQGSGLLIVTGDLETNGNTEFEGMILVLEGQHIEKWRWRRRNPRFDPGCQIRSQWRCWHRIRKPDVFHQRRWHQYGELRFNLGKKSAGHTWNRNSGSQRISLMPDAGWSERHYSIELDTKMNAPPTRKKVSNASGISVIEVLIVLAMGCIFAGFVCLKLIRGNDATNRQSTAVEFANHLQKARLDSMQRQVKDISQMAQVKVFNRKSYSMAIDADGDNQLDVPLVMNLPAEQGIEMNGPFPKTFIFDGFGQTVDSSNQPVTPEPVTLSNSAGASAVKFSETGEVIVVPAVKLRAAK